ncbi:unnamed protein product, partial [Didymodactylos carnosus]
MGSIRGRHGIGNV